MNAIKKTDPHEQAAELHDSTVAAAVDHIKAHHQKSDGFITLARKEGTNFRQHHYRIDQIPDVLQEWIGSDVYFSQNTFYKPRRLVENIRQLRSLYVDVDCYLWNYSPDWVIGQMELELFRQTVPEPNLIIHSGRGFNLIWLIDPVPYKALPLWQAVEDHLSRQFKSLGGDLKSTDAARVFRIAGSTNSKSGEQVTVQYRHNHRHSLRQIQYDYLPELTPKPKGTKKKRGSAKIRHMFNLYSLHVDRLHDLRRLIELREYDVKGHRETICFLYRYWNCCFVKDASDALDATLQLNSSFKDSLPESEVIKATKSAEAAAQNQKYKISNQLLKEWLSITEEEEIQLRTIIGKDEKRRRNTLAKRERRGSVDRCTYLARAAERRAEAQRMRENGMSYIAISEKLGITGNAVKMLFRKLR